MGKKRGRRENEEIARSKQETLTKSIEEKCVRCDFEDGRQRRDEICEN